MAAENENTTNKKRGIRWVIIISAFVMLSAGTFLFFAWQGKNLGAQVSGAPIFTANMKSVTLPSFTVNLAESRSRYLRTTITLESPAKKVAEELTTSPYRVKDSILKVLRNTSASSLEDPQQIERLKQELLNEVNASLTSGEVTGIYFEEFIMQ